jgi:hypothetical protein
MSHQGESELQEFQSFLKILQVGINKGLQNNLITTEIKKVIEVDLDTKEVKKEVPVTFEIKEEVKGVFITLVVKKEIEELEKLDIVQKMPNMNGIPKLVQMYTIKYSNYLYYCWIHESTFSKVLSHSNNNKGHRFPSRHTLGYIPIVCTSTTDVILDWKNFVKFYESHFLCEEVEIYAIENYPNLAHFSISWSS